MDVHEREDDFPSPAKRAKRNPSNLLSLPPEILQTIGWHMDASAFYTSLLTCKRFMEVATCRPNILRHLYNLPGIQLGLNDIPTAQLLLVFRKRATECLCGAGVLADVRRWNPVPSMASFSKAIFSPGPPPQFATAQDFAMVRVYELTSHHVRLKAELQTYAWEAGDISALDIIKMAFSSSLDLAVLYRARKPIKKHKVSPFVDELAETDKQMLKLVTFPRLHTSSRGFFYSSHQQETRDIRCGIDVEPVGLAIASNGNACIAYKTPEARGSTEMWLIGRNNKLMDANNYDSSPTTVILRDPPSMGTRPASARLIFNMQFIRKDRTLNFYKAGNPIHSYYTHSCDPEKTSSHHLSQENRVLINVQKNGSLSKFAVGMPFAGFHARSVAVDFQKSPVCRFFYLAIGISEDFGGSNVFIVQTERDVPLLQCQHEVNLEKGRRGTNWRALALLAGWRPSTSSLGTVMAISPGGGRIAAATWSRVLVWAFHPTLLHQGMLQHYFPARDYNPRKDVGRLRPIKLSTEGVIHNMLWADESKLYATTDRGLVRWDMGHLCVGEREDLSLAYDAWPETAIEMPAAQGFNEHCIGPVRRLGEPQG